MNKKRLLIGLLITGSLIVFLITFAGWAISSKPVYKSVKSTEQPHDKERARRFHERLGVEPYQVK